MLSILGDSTHRRPFSEGRHAGLWHAPCCHKYLRLHKLIMVLLCSERFIHQIQSRRKVLKSRKSHTPHGGRDWCLPPRVQQLVSLHEVPLPARQLQSEGCVCCFVQQRWQITTLGSMTRFSGLGYTFSVSNWCTPERRVPQPITVPRTTTGRMSSTVTRPRLAHTATSGVHELMSATL